MHRIGRTGRQNKTGTSYALFTEENHKCARELIEVIKSSKHYIFQDFMSININITKVLTEAGQEVNPALERLADTGFRSSSGKSYHKSNMPQGQG